MNKEEIENRILVCEIKANEYREVGNNKTSDRYDKERYKWEELLNQIKPIDEDYRRGYIQLQERIDKAIEYINNLKIWHEHNDNICSTEDKFKNDLLEILKGNDKE